MQKVIWTCWFQGRREAPPLVEKCLRSWEERNPGWELRCLDARTISKYIDLGSYVDLNRQSITAASLSDILRVLLLHEYGGVWVDATTFCNVPLDDWLPVAADTGFFAFSGSFSDLVLGSWFLAAESGNSLLAKWTARVVQYWHRRERSHDYFWLHRQFGQLCSIDKQAFRAWQAVPRISANDPPHAIQTVGMCEDFESVRSEIDWTVPVFKLTYRFDAKRLTPNSVIARLLNLSEGDEPPPTSSSRESPAAPAPIGLLKVDTENLGDHIQIIAAEGLLRRAGLVPSFTVDRDSGISHPPPVQGELAPGILLNGWFKGNFSEWPPHSAYRPLYLGFHISLYAESELISPAALNHYAAHGPIGCRDRRTLSLLLNHGVQAFLSNCPTITLARRLPDPERQTEVFVVSRDRRILDFLPASIGLYTFVSHYSGSNEFLENKHQATELLKTYRDRAKLVVTTMLHCALPAIAMGIPVVVFYPPNEGLERDADLARFSSLSELIRVFRVSEAILVDWQGYSPDVSTLKLKLLDSFFSMTERWGHFSPSPIGPIAPSKTLPVPDRAYPLCDDLERLDELERTKSPDRLRWGMILSYSPDWADRGKVAAQFIRDGSRVLEIGTGSGTLRRLIANRCNYTGADLEPLDDNSLVLDVDNEPLPRGSWDTIVLLGVLEYLHYPAKALEKIANTASQLVISYCCCVDISEECASERRSRGWVNSMTEQDIGHELARLGFRMSGRQLFKSTPHLEDIVFEFVK
jgi:hypothetical protein